MLKVGLRQHPFRQASGSDIGSDVCLSISQNAINDLLAAHFKANPEFYDWTKAPIWQTSLPPSQGESSGRFFKLFGRVVSTIQVDLNPSTSARYAAYWRNKLGTAVSVSPPPNIELCTEVLLILNFTDRHDPAGPGHKLDYKFKIKVGAYVEIVTEGASGAKLQATDWDIQIDSLGVDENDHPVPAAGDRIGSTSTNQDCEQELKGLRNEITDLFDFAANYAISKIARDFTYALPLPPIAQLAPEVRLTYGSLLIEEKTLLVGALVNRSTAERTFSTTFQSSLMNMNAALCQEKINELVASRARTYDEVNAWLQVNLPEHRAATEKLSRLLATMPSPGFKLPGSDRIDSDFQIWTNGRIFDAIAKEYLKADTTKCVRVFHVDAIAAYGDIDACVHLGLSDASGGVDGQSVFMGCNVDLEGYLKIQLCLRAVVCDPCKSYEAGIALKGPLSAGLAINNYSCSEQGGYWGFLTVRPFVGNFPGLEPIGLPPVIGDAIGAVTTAVTSFIFTAFLNALLSGIEFPVFDVPVSIPGTKVRCDFSNFKVANDGGFLKIGAQPRFSS